MLTKSPAKAGTGWTVEMDYAANGTVVLVVVRDSLGIRVSSRVFASEALARVTFNELKV